MKTKKIEKTDFCFRLINNGLYLVHYFTPIKKIEYKGIVSYMPIIDKTKNCEYPKAKDLRQLKKYLHKI